MAYTFDTKKINPDALDQDTHWFDTKGKEYIISEMSPKHAMNCLPKLFDAFGARVVQKPLYTALYKRALDSKHLY